MAVTFEFGAFRLDEPGRVFTLGERELPLQPRVFDLLAYLIRNRARVVSKDELLDALWPGVTVTENSLQRAVSTLRSVLREGGMEGTIRNFPSRGYRFCVDAEPDQGEQEQHAVDRAEAAHDDTAAAAQAVAEQRWSDAAALYAQLDRRKTLVGADLDRWALAIQCLGKPSEAIPILVRAIASYRKESRGGLAARLATTLSTLHLERGEFAIAKGWVASAQDLSSMTQDSDALGHILWMQSKISAFEGDVHGALELADAAYNFGLARGDGAAEVLGLMYRGFYRLSLGDTAAGLADQDHAAALALSQNVGPFVGGVLYCNILWACRSFGDWARANEWTLGYRQFCTDSRMEFSGSCQLHRAEVLGIRGSLHDALTLISDALARLSEDAPWALGDAHRVLGDVHAAIGNGELALAAYEQSYALGWNPEPGHAMLLLERGDADAAYANLERSIVGIGWWNLQRQGMLLAHLALVAAHAGRQERAQALIDDLAGQDMRWPMPSIRALTNEAAALLARQRGDPNEALRRLQLARQLWTSIDSRLNAARLRLEIAALQLSLGDKSGAGVEIRAAAAAAKELQSDKLNQRCSGMQHGLA